MSLTPEHEFVVVDAIVRIASSLERIENHLKRMEMKK